MVKTTVTSSFLLLIYITYLHGRDVCSSKDLCYWWVCVHKMSVAALWEGVLPKGVTLMRGSKVPICVTQHMRRVETEQDWGRSIRSETKETSMRRIWETSYIVLIKMADMVLTSQEFLKNRTCPRRWVLYFNVHRIQSGWQWSFSSSRSIAQLPTSPHTKHRNHT